MEKTTKENLINEHKKQTTPGKFQVVKSERKESNKVQTTTTADGKTKVVTKKLPSSGPGDVMLALVIILSLGISLLSVTKKKIFSSIFA